MVRIIHTSDVHIGAKFASFGKKAQTQRQSLLDVFAKTVDHAISSKANILLIAGDLFDSNFPSYTSVTFVKQQFRKLEAAGIYAAVVPGTHDCLTKDSIYKREDFTFELPHIFVFDENTTMKEFADIDLTVFARANTSNKSEDSPIAFLKEASRQASTKYKVAMAHGSVQIEGKAAADDMPVRLSEIADSGMDYIALGHWHGAQEFSFGQTTAWYSGSPEITYQEGKGGLGQGYILEVDLTDKAGVKPIKMTEKEVKELRIDMQVYENAENVAYELDKLADPHRILVAEIAGVGEPDAILALNPEVLEEAYRDKFFSIKIKNTAAPALSTQTDFAYPEELVIGQFVRIMRARIDATSDNEEKKLLQDALQIGIAELEGKNILSE